MDTAIDMNESIVLSESALPAENAITEIVKGIDIGTGTRIAIGSITTLKEEPGRIGIEAEMGDMQPYTMLIVLLDITTGMGFLATAIVGRMVTRDG